MRVVVYGPLRAATGRKTVEVAASADTIGDALEAFADQYPRARGQLFAENGALRPSVRVSRNGDRVDPEDACSPTDELRIVPAVQGGSSSVCKQLLDCRPERSARGSRRCGKRGSERERGRNECEVRSEARTSTRAVKPRASGDHGEVNGEAVSERAKPASENLDANGAAVSTRPREG